MSRQPMTDDRVDEIWKLWADATPGPWEVDLCPMLARPGVRAAAIDWPRCGRNQLAGMYGRGRPRIEADARFIAACPTIVGELLGERKRLLKEPRPLACGHPASCLDSAGNYCTFCADLEQRDNCINHLEQQLAAAELNRIDGFMP